MITREMLEERLSRLLAGLSKLEQDAQRIERLTIAQRSAIGEVETLLLLCLEPDKTDEIADPAQEQGIGPNPAGTPEANEQKESE